MVGRILERRNAVGSDLMAGGEGQQLLDVEVIPAVEDVVNGMASFAFSADLPRRVGRFLAVQRAVSRVEVEPLIGQDRRVDGLTRLGVKVTTNDQRPIVHMLVQELQNIFALFVT